MSAQDPGLDPIAALVHELSRLPGVGEKTATRLAYHLLRAPSEQSEALAEAISEARKRVGFCSSCQDLSTVDPCARCTDPRRDPKIAREAADERFDEFHSRVLVEEYVRITGTDAPIGREAYLHRFPDVLSEWAAGEIGVPRQAAQPGHHREAGVKAVVRLTG